MKFIFFHGSYGFPEENWMPYLKHNLESLGKTVITPSFPTEDWNSVTKKGPLMKPTNQNLERWLSAFKPTYEIIKMRRKLLE